MSDMPPTPEYRLARYYLHKLHTIDAMYQCGHEHSTQALALFDQEWSQIKHWGDWSAAHADAHQAVARLCIDYAQSSTHVILLRQHPQASLDWLQTGLAAAQRLADPQAEMVQLYLLGQTYGYLSASAAAKSCCEKALELAYQLDDRLYAARILISLGHAFDALDEYEQARQAHQHALVLSKQIGAKLEISAALNGLGNVALNLSENERALNYYQQFLEMAEVLGNPQYITLALRNLSVVASRIGDQAQAAYYAEHCVVLCRATGNRRHLVDVLAQLGDFASAQGILDEARGYYQQTITVARQIGYQSGEANGANRLGNLLCRMGQFEASLESLEASLAISKIIEERWFSVLALMNMSEVFRVTGDHEQAHQKLREGLIIVCSMQGSALRAKYVLAAALLWHDQQDSMQAAIWIGLVQEHVSKLNAEQLDAYHALRQTLERELSAKQFAAACRAGEDLDLHQTTEHILHLLTTSQPHDSAIPALSL